MRTAGSAHPESTGLLDATTERARTAAHEALAGRSHGLHALLPFLGPAFIASVAYVDPGNFATNIQGGAQFGYRLLWVVLFANLAAMLFQYLSAKLGIVSGKNLPELCREHYSGPVVVAMWLVSEFAAMATDLAEFLGAAIALELLFHIPLIVGALATGLITYGMLLLERYGFRPVEAVIAGLVGVIGLSYLAETLIIRPNVHQMLLGTFVPTLAGPSSILLAVGIIGATVMPHAVYLHSGLTQNRVVPESPEEARRIVRFENVDVLLALGLAGLVNMAMLAMAAAAFYSVGHADLVDISAAYRTLTPLLGGAASFVFLLSLLASGLSSSAVGTMAGQIIMQGFVGFRIPVWVRRVVTMVPALLIIALGVNPVEALVLSQVVLSLALPVPMITLLRFTQRKDLMGPLATSRVVTLLGVGAGAIILLLNAVLLWSTVGLSLPFGL